MRCAFVILFCLSLIIPVFLYYCYRHVYGDEIFSDLNDVTLEIESLFKNLDTDRNGVLNFSEFLTLQKSYRIFQRNHASESLHMIQGFPDLSVQLGEQIINVEAHFKPLVLSSLRKKITDVPKEEISSLQGLLNWNRPYKEKHPFGAKSFSTFLPPKAGVKPGYLWRIIESKFDKQAGPVLGRRYFPTRVPQNLLVLHSLLSLFHPQPFLWTRFEPQGTVAIIRATDANFYDIVFRVHAEFQLNQPPLHPFWFTPSQFRGRLIINKDGTVVKFFHMGVPETKVNVDMEWYNGESEDSMEVDIGYIPEMFLISSAISVPGHNERGSNQKLSSLKWTSEISMEDAIESLESHFFSFKKVKYYNFPDAFHKASNESKLVHGLILWGNLNDQSC